LLKGNVDASNVSVWNRPLIEPMALVPRPVLFRLRSGVEAVETPGPLSLPRTALLKKSVPRCLQIFDLVVWPRETLR